MIATYDFVMLAVFAGAILFGFWKGLAWQIASLAAIFVSYIVALNFRGTVANLIRTEAPWNGFIAMAILYLGTSLVIWIAFGVVRRNIERFQLKEFDRQSGALLGAVKGALLCMVITLFAVTIVPGDNARRAVMQSRSGNFIASTINRFSAVVPKEIHGVLAPYLDPYVNKFNERLAQPLPPETSSSSGGSWIFGQPVANDAQPGANTIRGQFQLPVSIGGDSTSGINVNVDAERLLNNGWNALQNGINNQLQQTPQQVPPQQPQFQPFTPR